jgi:hypothetical protein
VPAFEFTLFLEGADLFSEGSKSAREELPMESGGLDVSLHDAGLVGADAELFERALPYRSQDFFEGAQFGGENGVEYVTFDLVAATEDEAVNWAAAMLRYALPRARIAGVRRGPYGSVRIR